MVNNKCALTTTDHVWTTTGDLLHVQINVKLQILLFIFKAGWMAITGNNEPLQQIVLISLPLASIGLLFILLVLAIFLWQLQ